MVIIDVGCRVGLPEGWDSIGADVIGFDPDPDECARLSSIYPHYSFYPVALDSEPSERKFWLTENPQCSSLYKPDQQFLDKGFAGHRIIGEKTVSTVDLDGWMDTNRPGLKVDVLKLDTQGSELDILKGATQTLEGFSWVVTEVEFVPLYESQPLFADVDTFLRSKGFEFWNLMDVNYRGGQMIWADAYYLKPPNEGRTQEIGRIVGCHPR